MDFNSVQTEPSELKYTSLISFQQFQKKKDVFLEWWLRELFKQKMKIFN